MNCTLRVLTAMRIELLAFDGCPSHEAFLPRLWELLERSRSTTS